jgi:hypothetical protein
LAEVLQLEVTRDPDGVLHRAVRPGPPRPTAWSDLHYFNAPGTRDRRTAIRVYAKLGLFPILLHGVNDDGSCMCGKAGCEKSIGKHPVATGWQRKTTVDIDGMDRALLENPAFNIGLRMGVQPGGFRLLGLDVDGPRETLAPLEAELGPLPPTLTSRSGSGLGQHLIYKISAELEVKNSVRVAGHKLDLRCDGGQIVAPPSKHRSGGFYEWIDMCEPAVLP